MSHTVGTERRRVPVRAIVAVGSAVAGVGLLVGGGTLLPVQTAAPAPSRAAAVGRTTTICTAGTGLEAEAAATARTSVTAVALRPARPRDGRLSGAALDGAPAELEVTGPGKGATVSQVTAPLVLTAEGGMAASTGAAVLGSGSEGEDTGLLAAPCQLPGTAHWFSGLGATGADQTDLVLTNPDDAQAEVDLRFYGRTGRVVVPGSPGLVIDANSTRTVSLSSLVRATGALGLSVSASEGRVVAVAKRVRTAKLKPAGVDWQVPAAAPSRALAIPAVPGGEGSRELVVTNPGLTRALVGIKVLGLQGAFAPSGADTIEVPPESSAAIELSTGLAGDAATVTLTSDEPVTGAVISESDRSGASADVAVQSADQPLVRTGLSAVATTTLGDSELILSNTGVEDASVTFEVFSLDGVSLRSEDILLGYGATATRRLTTPAPSYVMVTAPNGSSVVGGVVLTQSEDDVAGLATLPLTSPDVAGRAPRGVSDPTVGR